MKAVGGGLIVAVRSVWCEVEAFHRTDGKGDYTVVEVATTDGWPVFEAEVDGHLTAVEIRKAASDLGSGNPTPDVNWVDVSRTAA
jgi:hypothetical protein